MKDISAADLGAVVVREAIGRARVSPGDVGDVVLGCVLQAGNGMNVASQAALNEPTRVAVAPDGSVYIAELQGGVIRVVNPRGTIATYAGGGNEDAVPTP